MSLLKVIKGGIRGTGLNRMVEYLLSITFTMYWVWRISTSIPLETDTATYVFYGSLCIIGWLYADTVFLKSFERVRTLRLYSDICFYLSIASMLGVALYDVGFSGIFYFGFMSFLFKLKSNSFHIPKFIEEDFRYMTLPKIYEIGYISLFYDMLFYINHLDKDYEFHIDTERFSESQLLGFSKDIERHVIKYCDKISTKKAGDNLVVTINYNTFDSQNEKIKQLKTDTNE